MRMTAEFVEMLNKLQTGELKIGKLQFDPEKQRYDFTLEASSPPQEDEPTYYKLDNPHQVFFYEQEFYMFSNFSAFRLKWQGVNFDTSEHAYHFQKFDYLAEDDVTRRELVHIRFNIRNAISAHEAFKFAERNKNLRRPDWDEVKTGMMIGILRAKVQQHEYVRRKLLETGDRELIEDSWRDSYWGWGPDRKGLTEHSN